MAESTDISPQLEVLDLSPGDTVVITVDYPLSLDQAAEMQDTFTRWREREGLEDVYCLIVEDSVDVSTLDGDEMRELGWVRADEGDADD